MNKDTDSSTRMDMVNEINNVKVQLERYRAEQQEFANNRADKARTQALSVLGLFVILLTIVGALGGQRTINDTVKTKIKEHGGEQIKADLDTMKTNAQDKYDIITAIHADLTGAYTPSSSITSTNDMIRIGDVQICWGRKTEGEPSTGKHVRTVVFDYPETFIDNPSVTHGIHSQNVQTGRSFAVYNYTASKDQYRISVITRDGHPVSGSVQVNYIAIGKWR